MVPEDTTKAIGLVSVWMEVSALRQLTNWEPVGSLLELLQGQIIEFGSGCIRELHDPGSEGITKSEIDRLRKWAKRWVRLSSALRKFYSVESDWELESYYLNSQSIDRALWKILHDDVGVKPSPTLYRAISERWRARYGSEPSVELIPNLSFVQLWRNDVSRVRKEVGD